MTKKSAMSKILIVEDDPDIRELLRFNLEKAGYTLFLAEDGEKALTLARKHSPDIILLDLMLPGVDGLEVCRTLKKDPELQRIPVIMVTAKGEELDRVVGLELGADDYVVKPFSPQELVSRVKAVLRRTRGSAPGDAERAIEFEGLRIDPRTHLVQVKGKEESLTAKEFDLLWLLARHPRQVFGREQLLDLVWGLTEYVDPSTVTVHVRRLREKIELDPSNPRHIQTVWGVGYKFEP